MKRRTMVRVACVVSLLLLQWGARQTARADTTSEDQQIADAQVAADHATQAANAARLEVTKALEQSPQYIQLAREVSAAQTAEAAASKDEAAHRAAVSRLTDLKRKLGQMRLDALGESRKLRDAQDQAAQLTTSLRELTASINKARAADEADAAAPVVSATRLNILGDRYNGVRIKLIGATFHAADNQWVRLLPGVRHAPDENGKTLDEAALNNWVGFSVIDPDNHIFEFAFADKTTFGDKIADMKEGTVCTIYGTVVPLGHAGWYGLVCDRIEP